jgi:hypothetical protein
LATECFSALPRKERERQIGAAHRQLAWAQVERDLADNRLNLATLTTEA